MIRSLPKSPDNSRRALRIGKSARHRGLEFLCGDMVRTRERGQHALIKKACASEVQFPIAAQRVIDLATSASE